MEEMWADVVGYEGFYRVSNLGSVEGLARKCRSKGGSLRAVAGKPIKQFASRCGYLVVVIQKEGKAKNVTVHRLVAKAFIPNSLGYRQVNHKDGNKKNNKLENLEWCNASQNMRHAIDNGLRNTPSGERSSMAKHTDAQIREVIALLKAKQIPSVIERKTGINNKVISGVNRHRTWRSLTASLPNPIASTDDWKAELGRKRSRLSDGDIASIVEMAGKGIVQREIAQKFGICQVYVSNIYKEHKKDINL